MTVTDALLAVGAVIIVFVLVRGFGRSKVVETDHRQDRERIDVVDDALDQKIVHSLHHVGKINAIKDLREATGWGLREAKDYVEELELKYPLPRGRN